MLKIKIALFTILAQGFLHAQKSCSIKVVDAYSLEPLSFANLTFNGDNAQAEIADIEGYFNYLRTVPLNEIRCSYIGYQSTAIQTNGRSHLTIKMIPEANVLHEVTVKSGENEVNSIIRKVIQNRQKNVPEQLSSFTYHSYNKSKVDFLYYKNQRDSLAVYKILKNSHIFLTESATIRKYLKPAYSEETVLATKVSGLKNPAFAILATDLQPFTFYQDYIKLFDIRYMNPIANGSLNKYRFVLQDVLYQQRDTIYQISFEPKPHKNTETLKGILYINSNGYAVQNVVASPYEKGKVDIKIQQKYQLIQGSHWFPEQLNYTITAEGYPNKDIGIYAEGKSSISEVVLNLPLQKSNFSAVNVQLASTATLKDSAYWNAIRPSPLSDVEKRTYQVVDSIGSANHFDQKLKILEKIVNGKIPWGMVDIDVMESFVYNRYEGYRLGLGLYTNSLFSTKVSIGGFYGFGLKDQTSKYGASISYMANKERELTIGAAFQNNLQELGESAAFQGENSIFDLRTWMGYAFDNIKQIEVNTAFRTGRYVQWYFSIKHTEDVPRYNYVFLTKTQSTTSFTNAELAFQWRFAFGENRVQAFGNILSTPSQDYPVFQIGIYRGLRGWLDGQFSYNKIIASAEQQLYTNGFGLTSYRLEGGYCDRSLPASLLFTGEGSFDSQLPFLIKNTFQTMKPYAFLSDQYVHLFLSHNFGTLLLKNELMQPSISLLHNVGCGILSNEENHIGLPFQIQDRLYCEAGLKLDNLVKLNYANIGYLGLGVAGFYNYGAYAKSQFNDNAVFKATINFTIK